MTFILWISCNVCIRTFKFHRSFFFNKVVIFILKDRCHCFNLSLGELPTQNHIQSILSKYMRPSDKKHPVPEHVMVCRDCFPSSGIDWHRSKSKSKSKTWLDFKVFTLHLHSFPCGRLLLRSQQLNSRNCQPVLTSVIKAKQIQNKVWVASAFQWLLNKRYLSARQFQKSWWRAESVCILP